MYRRFLFCLLVLYSGIAAAQARTDAPLRELLFRKASPALRHVLSHPDSFRVQLIFTTITRDAKGKPAFRDWHFQTDRDKYFNPASTVKMPLAFLALIAVLAVAAFLRLDLLGGPTLETGAESPPVVAPAPTTIRPELHAPPSEWDDNWG